ncbi:MAG: pyruvate kinase, partial [Akkermansia sp.]
SGPSGLFPSGLPALTEKDLKDLKVAVECETDYVAMSFVRDAAHIAELREHIDNLGGRAQIIAKIEDQQAIRHIDDIILAADVIMVARGDLGIEVSIEELPIISAASSILPQAGRRCIVATRAGIMITNLPHRASNGCIQRHL